MNLSNNMAKEYVENMQRMFSKDENGVPNNFLGRALSYSFLQSKDSFIEEKLPENLFGRSVYENRLSIGKKVSKESVRVYLKSEGNIIVLQEFISSMFINAYGCITPKNKIISDKEGNLIAGSKEMRITQIDHFMVDKEHPCYEPLMMSFQLFTEFPITYESITSSLKRDNMIDYANLMSILFLIIDTDSNLNNFFITPEGRIGKIDHDNAMWGLPPGRELNIPKILRQVYSDGKQCSVYYDEYNMSLLNPHEKEFLLSKNQIIPCIYFLSSLFGTNNVCTSEPPEYKTVELNTNFFTYENINNLMKSPEKTFMFLVWLTKMNQMINMPKEIIDYMFSEQLLGEDFKRLSPAQQKKLQKNISEIKTRFNNHVERLKKFIELPLRRLDDLKQCLRDAQIELPPEPDQKQLDEVKRVINDPIRKELKLSLHELKKKLKEPGFRKYYIALLQQHNTPVTVSQPKSSQTDSVNVPYISADCLREQPKYIETPRREKSFLLLDEIEKVRNDHKKKKQNIQLKSTLQLQSSQTDSAKIPYRREKLPLLLDKLTVDHTTVYRKKFLSLSNQGYKQQDSLDSTAVIPQSLDFKAKIDEHISRGLRYAKENKHTEAIWEFNKALEIDPQNAIIFMYKVISYKKKGDFKGALYNYNQAIKLDKTLEASLQSIITGQTQNSGCLSLG